MQNKKVGIIGCGWLGKPLYDELKKDFNVECYSKEGEIPESKFWNCDTIVIAINTKREYFLSVKYFLQNISKNTNLILMSSISVYREFECDVDEDVKITKDSLQRDVENLVMSSHTKSVILRLGGLMGYDRVSGRWSNKKEFEDGFVNYIHRDDVIAVVKKILQKGLGSGVYNIVAPQHPLRSEVHKLNAQKFGFKVGSFTGMSKRRVLCSKISKELNYSFIYPNPLEFWG